MLSGAWMLFHWTGQQVDIAPPVHQQVGAVSDANNLPNCLTYGGQTHCYYRQSFNSASTTICSFPNYIASSTLANATVNVTTGTSSAMIIEMGKATTNAATTTLIGAKFTLAAGDTPTIVASTSPVTTSGLTAFSPVATTGPTSYFNVKAGGPAGAGTLNLFAGTCDAEYVLQ